MHTIIKCKTNKVKQNGSALLSALFIMTLVAITATAMTTRLQSDIYRTGLIIKSNQLYLASQAGLFWGMYALKKPSKKPYVALNKQGTIQYLPKELKDIYPHIQLEGEIIDLQSKFNINNLSDKQGVAAFNQLLKEQTPAMKKNERRNLILSIKDWISDYKYGQGYNSYLHDYLKMKPPYLPAHQPIKNISELILVKDMNFKIYQKLYPFLTALPEKTKININTAPPTLIKTMGNGLNAGQVAEIIELRKQNPFLDLIKMSKRYSISTKQIGTESHYYLIKVTAKFEQMELTNYSIVKRKMNKKKKIQVNFISETLNSF